MRLAIVDTNVVSMLIKSDTRSKLYDAHLASHTLGISFMTLAELDRWALERNWGSARRMKLAEHMDVFAVYYADRELCMKWAEVKAESRRRGRPIETADAWIAATALFYRVPLITHNRSDFESVDGLEIISES